MSEMLWPTTNILPPDLLRGISPGILRIDLTIKIKSSLITKSYVSSDSRSGLIQDIVGKSKTPLEIFSF